MQTNLAPDIRETENGRQAEAILRSCVHCGFCNATCPTYQLLGDELDGPRGRIYLIKQMLEGQAVTAHTQTHLDRCLTCRNCETTCPSGVEYGRLLEIGRETIEQRVPRPAAQRLIRRLLRNVVPYRGRMAVLVGLARPVRLLLPPGLRRMLPTGSTTHRPPTTAASRSVLLLQGCAQPALAPGINQRAHQLLGRLDIEAVEADQAGCCGALSLHLGARKEAQDFARRNIDAWWPHLERGAEAILGTASGCTVMLRDYDQLLADDPDYAEKARVVASRVRDIGEFMADEAVTESLQAAGNIRRIAFHAPCTLQHGLHVHQATERLMQALGFELTAVPDAHLCCGSAGTYSILQKRIAGPLTDNKIAALESDAPQAIATANIGCLLELKKRARVPVVHWVELIEPRSAD